jgi:hypothetical protein
LLERLTPLAAENLRLSNLVAQTEVLKSGQDDQPNDLLRLRAEVTRLRSGAAELARLKAASANTPNDASIEATAKTLAARATQLKQRLEQMPDKKIPELQFLSQKDWLDAVSNLKQLETDDDFRRALSNLRSSAKSDFGTQMQKALRQFVESSGGMLPTDLSQIQQYFASPVDATLLGRYQLLQTGKLSDLGQNQSLIGEIAPPVDDEYDTRFEFDLSGTTSHSVSGVGDAVEAAATAYANANNGLLPRDSSQLTPYLQQAIDPARIQKFLSQIPPGITTLEQMQQAHR